MGRIIYGETENHPLDVFLAEHDMGHVGGVRELADIPDLLRGLAPLWWDYTAPAYGAIHADGGYRGSATSGLIDGREVFAEMCATGIEALTVRLARDHSRIAQYGDDHAGFLTLTFGMYEREITETMQARFADDTKADVAEGTKVAVLSLEAFPTWVNSPVATAMYVDVRSPIDPASRITSVDSFDQAHALRKGWKFGLAETARHDGPDPATGAPTLHKGPRALCSGPDCS